MNRYKMIANFLNEINIIEDINFSNIKSKSQQIGSAAASGNILKMKLVFDNIPEIPIDSLNTIARKKFPAEYKNSELIVSKKVKGKSRIKNILTLALTSLTIIKKESKDPEITEKVNNSLEQFDKILLKTGAAIGSGNLTFILFARIIQFFTETTTFLASLLVMPGIIFTAAAIFIVLTNMIIETYIEAKKLGKKVIE